MSKEFFDDKYDAKDDNIAWSNEWAAERKLNPDDAHEMLRTLFVERLTEWRRSHPDEDCWVIPFYYRHEDDEDAWNHKGALWIPPEHIQEVINRVGSYIHMSAMIEMESELLGTGIVTNHQRPSIMDLSTEVPSVFVNPMLSMVLRYSASIERDFGVTVHSNLRNY